MTIYYYPLYLQLYILLIDFHNNNNNNNSQTSGGRIQMYWLFSLERRRRRDQFFFCSPNIWITLQQPKLWSDIQSLQFLSICSQRRWSKFCREGFQRCGESGEIWNTYRRRYLPSGRTTWVIFSPVIDWISYPYPSIHPSILPSIHPFNSIRSFILSCSFFLSTLIMIIIIIIIIMMIIY